MNKRQRKKAEKRSGDVFHPRRRTSPTGRLTQSLPALQNIPIPVMDDLKQKISRACARPNQQTIIIDSVTELWEQVLREMFGDIAGGVRTVTVTDYEDITHKRIAGPNGQA